MRGKLAKVGCTQAKSSLNQLFDNPKGIGINTYSIQIEKPNVAKDNTTYQNLT
jgi:hypothetical protein